MNGHARRLTRRSYLAWLAAISPAVALADDAAQVDKQKLRAYESALEILNDLPEKLKPKTKVGWDKYRFDEVTPWLSTEPVGRLFQSRFKIGTAYVAKVQQSVARITGHSWTLRYDFVDRIFQFRGLEIKEQIVFASVFRPHLSGDESFARRAEKVTAGQNVSATGIIKSISFSGWSRLYKLRITLEGVEVRSATFDAL